MSTPEPPLDRLALDATEKAFIGDMWRAAPPAFAAERGIELRTAGALQASVIGGLPQVPMLNLVLGAPEAEPARLAAMLDWVESRDVVFYVPVTPGLPGSAAAERLLAERGYARGYGWMKFVRDAAPPPPRADRAGVEVVELAAGEGAPFGRVVAEGFGMPAWMGELFAELPGAPGWRCYLAHVDGEPAGSAALRVHGEVAEFGLAATLPAARGRGAQGALLHRRIRDAAAAGARTLLVETGEAGADGPGASYRNILRAGFQESYVRPNWMARNAPA